MIARCRPVAPSHSKYVDDTAFSPSRPFSGHTVTIFTPSADAPAQAGISSNVPFAAASICRCRNGTSAPATNAARNAEINAGNGNRAAVVA